MRKLVFRSILLLLIFFTLSSFGQVSKKVDQKYVGIYKTADQKSCPITLTISSTKDGYHYKIRVKTKEKEGRLQITKSGNEIYLSFVGLIAQKPKTEVEGQYIDNNVVIQNEGNAMNKFTIFGACDDKYIELNKVGKN